MTKTSKEGASTRVSVVIKAPRRPIYEAFLDHHAVASWLPAGSMVGHVHSFDPREGGKF